MRNQLGELNAQIAQLRGKLKQADDTPELIALRRDAQLLQNQIWDAERAFRRMPADHVSSDVAFDPKPGRISSGCLPPISQNRARQSDNNKPRTETLPIQIAHDKDLQTQGGKLAVDYEIYEPGNYPSGAITTSSLTRLTWENRPFPLQLWPDRDTDGKIRTMARSDLHPPQLPHQQWRSA